MVANEHAGRRPATHRTAPPFADLALLGVAIVGPSIYYGSSGMTLFSVYFVILSFAMTVVVMAPTVLVTV